MAELEADPVWVARRQADDAELEREKARLREQEAPLLRDLAAIEIEVESVWDLGHAPAAAVPVLLRYLERDYDIATLEGIARALAVEEALPYWDELMRHATSSAAAGLERRQLAEGLAATLSQIATRDQLADVRSVLAGSRLSGYRSFFLHTLTRLRVDDRWEVIASLADDPEIGAAASHLLHQRDLRLRRMR